MKGARKSFPSSHNAHTKMETLKEEIKALINPEICDTKVSHYLNERLAGDYKLTRDEGEPKHFCCYFFPYDLQAKKVFIVHHKKAQLWLAPGGHMDSKERPIEALNREVREELGVSNVASEAVRPFLLTITPINNPRQPKCQEHLDIWYSVPTDGSNFNIDPSEFLETRWVTIDEARKLVTDPPNLEAIDRIEKIFGLSA